MKRLLVPVLCLLFAAGCVNYDGGMFYATPSATPAAEILPPPPELVIANKEGGILKLPMRSPATLNPILNGDATVDRILKLVFEPLTRLNENFRPVANLADVYVSYDCSFAVVTIRNDAMWHDGVPVTSDDFLYTLDAIANAPENSVYKKYAGKFSGAERIDSKTAQVYFSERYGGSVYLFDFPLIPQHYYRGENNPSSVKNMSPLGNGLFVFEERVPFTSVIFKSNPYSFRTRPYVEFFEAVFIPDRETELDAFDQGVTDVLFMEMTEWSRHRSVKQVHYGDCAAMYFEMIGFNFENPLLRNKLFRRAVAHMLDADEIISSVYLSHAVRALSPMHPASWLCAENLTEYEYNRELAGALVERVRAGETLYETERAQFITIDDDEEEDGGDFFEGYVPPNVITEFPVFKILVNEENAERIKTAQIIADAFGFQGLDAFLEIVPFEIFTEKIITGDYDLYVGGYTLGFIPYLKFIFTEHLFYDAYGLEEMLDGVTSAETEYDLLEAMEKLQSHVAEELPMISLAFLNMGVLAGTRVAGEIIPSFDDALANVNEWYVR